jgi:two-component system chemotaxis response regulator CheB
VTVPKLRVLVVEDSSTVRNHMCAVLSADPELELVGTAADGKRAIELCQELRPDVMTLDMMLPEMTGLAVTEYVMAYCATPILIVSSSTNRGELFRMYDALAAGAVDVLEKPLGDESDVAWEQRFVAAVKLVARIRVITHPRARLGALGRPRSEAPVHPIPVDPRSKDRELVALGASTGGPGALVTVLRGLPQTFVPPILIVLHIGELFAAAFGSWLEGQTGRTVVHPNDGDALPARPGTVVLAPPGRHLALRRGRLRLESTPERHSCRPSIDVLFESLAQEGASLVVAALLTGMGRDGALGLRALRQAGAYTIAQDEASSLVYGMPREAAALDAARRVLPLDEIGPCIASAIPTTSAGRVR